jgi:hypothetical protein
VDGVLAEVDCQTDDSLGWTEQVKVLAHRLRAVPRRAPASRGAFSSNL